MKNLFTFEKYSPGNKKESILKKSEREFLNNLGKAGQRLQFSSKDDKDLTSSVNILLGRALSKMSQIGSSLSKDFGIEGIRDSANYRYYSTNRKKYINKWAQKNLKRNHNYSEKEIERVYRDLKKKGKERFGEDYNFIEPGIYATNDEKMWSSYAIEILNKYKNN